MYLAVQLVVGLSEMARKAKDKRFFFFFSVSEVAFYFFGLFDVCMKQCCPTVNWNFILLSCYLKKKKSQKK